MGKCKNIECTNETKKGRVYCSLTCRNVYVNKHLRDYTKNGKSLSGESNYTKNPKKCNYCGEDLPYNKRRNSYCNSSCAAKISNLGRVHSEETKNKISLKNTSNEIKTIKCKNCDKSIPINDRKLYCSSECRKTYKRKNIEEYRQYHLDCKFKFNLSDYNEEFNFRLIEEYGWYAPSNSNKPNIGGVSRDHIFSISEGYKQGVDPSIISHPANCRLMVHGDNISKGGGCDITIKELLNNIEKWDKKYKR